MDGLPITETEVEKILKTSKVVNQNVKWKTGANKSWFSCNLNVENDLNFKLTLILNINIELTSKFSFSLLLNHIYRIRGLDVNGSHENKCTDGKKFKFQTHKHSWSDKCGTAHAYKPSDITGTTHEEVFQQFCKECNINFTGKFLPLPSEQLRLEWSNGM